MDDDARETKHAELLKAMGENYTRSMREQFKLQQGWPHVWFDRADKLVHAADVLNARYQHVHARYVRDPMSYFSPPLAREPWHDLSLLQTVYFLYALATENVLKGTVAALGKPIPKSHNLRKLAMLADVSLDERQLVLIGELTALVVWGGRYPLPLTIDEFTPRTGPRDMPSIPGELGHMEQSEVVRMLESLFKNLHEQTALYEKRRIVAANR